MRYLALAFFAAAALAATAGSAGAKPLNDSCARLYNDVLTNNENLYQANNIVFDAGDGFRDPKKHVSYSSDLVSAGSDLSRALDKLTDFAGSTKFSGGDWEVRSSFGGEDWAGLMPRMRDNLNDVLRSVRSGAPAELRTLERIKEIAKNIKGVNRGNCR